MRSFEEIETDIRSAIRNNDVGSLRLLARELHGLGSDRAEALAMTALGNAAEFTGDFPPALENYQRATVLYETLNDRAGLARVTGYMGIVYRNIGDYPAALECYQRALVLYEDLDNGAGKALTTNNIGIVYGATGDYPAALEYYQRALAMHEELGNRGSAAMVINNMGMVSWVTNDHPSALENFHRALAVHEELNDGVGVATVMSNMGNVYLATDDPSLALEHSHKALNLYEELGHRAGVARVTGNIIEALLVKEGSLEQLDLQATMVMDDPDVRAAHAAHRAKIAEATGDLDAAHDHLKTGLLIASDAGLRHTISEFHLSLRGLAQKRGDFDGYIEHNNEYLRLSEEIRGKEATQRLALMEVERRISAEFSERDTERALLYSALPETIASRMLRGEDVSGDHFDNASVLFLDIVGFTEISDRSPPGHVVHFLERIFSALDDVCAEHGVTKIKTIGDSYLAVAFPETGDQSSENGQFDRKLTHAQRAAACAVEMMKTMNTLQVTMPPELGETSWTEKVGDINVRIGVHCGPITAGVIGKERLQYDIWGDTVNVASRMESTGEPGKIQVSSEFHEQLSGQARSPVSEFWSPKFTERGEVNIKGKGTMTTYWLEGA